jgi:DNA-binding transcriptional ArsR family regulator
VGLTTQKAVIRLFLTSKNCYLKVGRINTKIMRAVMSKQRVFKTGVSHYSFQFRDTPNVPKLILFDNKAHEHHTLLYNQYTDELDFHRKNHVKGSTPSYTSLFRIKIKRLLVLSRKIQELLIKHWKIEAITKGELTSVSHHLISLEGHDKLEMYYEGPYRGKYRVAKEIPTKYINSMFLSPEMITGVHSRLFLAIGKRKGKYYKHGLVIKASNDTIHLISWNSIEKSFHKIASYIKMPPNNKGTPYTL